MKAVKVVKDAKDNDGEDDVSDDADENNSKDDNDHLNFADDSNNDSCSGGTLKITFSNPQELHIQINSIL